ncbi:MAG: ribonuclease III [Patescibacteria group bacterium]
MERETNYTILQLQLGYTFQDQRLLLLALTHRSYLNEISHKSQDKGSLHNERLEFLGDAVLELIVTDHLFKNYPELPEGKLTAIRASLVNYRMLASIAEGMQVLDFIRLSRGERQDMTDRSKLPILADCFEAILGAVYLDGGLKNCEKIVEKHVFPLVEDIIKSEAYKDSKSRLQEYYQSLSKTTPHYQIIAQEGKEHDKLFTVAVFAGTIQLSTGVGKSKQEAELDAATNALEKIEFHNN